MARADRPMPVRFRLRSYLRVKAAADGSLRLTSVAGPLDVPAVQGSRLLLRLLQALQEECSLSSLAGRVGLGGDVVEPFVRDFLAMGLLEAVSDHRPTPLGAYLSREEEDPGRLLAALDPLPVRVCGCEDDVRLFGELAAAEGLPLAPASNEPVLVVWLASGQPWPPAGAVPLLLCVPAHEGRGFLGPLFTADAAPCPDCWLARLAAHRSARLEARELEGMESLPVFACRLFLSHVLREVLARLLARPVALAPGCFKTLEYWSGELRTHRFLPLPQCQRCDGLPERPDEGPRADFTRSVPGLVDPLSGVFRFLNVARMETRGIPLFSASARLGDTRALGRSWSYETSGGVGMEASQASARALGEGLERYCASMPGGRPQEPRAWKEVGEAALSPARFSFFSREQYEEAGFPYTAPTADTPLRWSRALALPQRREVLVPSALVCLPYEPALPEPPLVPAHSHGLACGPSLDAAIMAGLCELVERDAFTLFWQQQRPRPRLCGLEGARGRLRGLFDETRARGWRLCIYDLRRESPMPVFLVTASPTSHGEGSAWPCFWVGAAASPDPEHALERAFLELFQNHRHLAALPQRPSPGGGSAEPSTFDDVDSFEAHALFYNRHPRLLERLSFLHEGDRVDLRDLGSPARGDRGDEVSSWSECLQEHGFTVLACDLTTRDVRSAGLHVVRVVVPEMVRLHSEHALPFLGSPRLEGARNPYPHPFP